MNKLPFGKKNYQWMIIGFTIIALGFTLMSLDKTEHGFGFLGLTLGPITVVVGFALEIFAILQKPQEKN
jgi:uncharacterized membrane protein